ncbi:hypothetical protein GLOIN_2v1479801 [Rhizophagus clarus]|uniref:Uncharacterized protein n=1 Tax=Rhizophagus clarus TaxID=94130 RepID=A0A8H3R445_9GLOM|nr:hypothetical protein GLOIN_2v1479801 [Rhizophagus clarus]
MDVCNENSRLIYNQTSNKMSQYRLGEGVDDFIYDKVKEHMLYKSALNFLSPRSRSNSRVPLILRMRNLPLISYISGQRSKKNATEIKLTSGYLDKEAEKARNICVYLVQCIGDRITLIEEFMEVFELLYALMKDLKIKQKD